MGSNIISLNSFIKNFDIKTELLKNDKNFESQYYQDFSFYLVRITFNGRLDGYTIKNSAELCLNEYKDTKISYIGWLFRKRDPEIEGFIDKLSSSISRDNKLELLQHVYNFLNSGNNKSTSANIVFLKHLIKNIFSIKENSEDQKIINFCIKLYPYFKDKIKERIDAASIARKEHWLSIFPPK